MEGKFDEAMVERLAMDLCDEFGESLYADESRQQKWDRKSALAKESYRLGARNLLSSLSQDYAIVALAEYLVAPKMGIDGENIVLAQCEWVRITDENNVLWAILKTCPGCRRLVTGILYGCDIQHHIDLSGHCNQYESEDTPNA